MGACCGSGEGDVVVGVVKIRVCSFLFCPNDRTRWAQFPLGTKNTLSRRKAKENRTGMVMTSSGSNILFIVVDG